MGLITEAGVLNININKIYFEEIFIVIRTFSQDKFNSLMGDKIV